MRDIPLILGVFFAAAMAVFLAIMPAIAILSKVSEVLETLTF